MGKLWDREVDRSQTHLGRGVTEVTPDHPFAVTYLRFIWSLQVKDNYIGMCVDCPLPSTFSPIGAESELPALDLVSSPCPMVHVSY